MAVKKALRGILVLIAALIFGKMARESRTNRMLQDAQNQLQGENKSIQRRGSEC